MDFLYKHTIVQYFQWCYLLVISLQLVTLTSSLEEPNPEKFLQPRNFNPHPYEIRNQEQDRNGPVVFPPNVEDNLVEMRNSIVTLRGNPPTRESHPVDFHPYAQVARKNKYKAAGRFSNEESQVNPQVYQGLTKHANRVLSLPPETLAKDYVRDIYNKEQNNYAFSYKVLDSLTGDDFSHRQSRNSKATNGEYRVKLPDGRVQIVSYRADKNGYKADVKYTENDQDTAQHGKPHQEENVQIQRIPVRNLYPVSQDYEQDVREPEQKLILVQTVLPTQIPQNYIGDATVVPTSPAYLNIANNRHLQNPVQPKVQIYTTNARDYSVGSYIPSTTSPYLEKTDVGYSANILSPQIFNNGNQGIYIQTTPSSFVVTDQHGEVLDNIKLVSSTTPTVIIENDLGPTTPATYVLNQRHYRSVTPKKHSSYPNK